MSKRKLLVTILIFIVTIALVVGASYLASLLLKNQNTKKSLVDTENIVYSFVDTSQGLD